MKSNLFDNVPEELPVELCETLVESSSVRIERIISKGHSSPEQGWYDQTENEWVMVVKGQASLLFEGDENPVPMQQGDYINIPAGRKHKVLWTHPDMETFWIAVFYS
ncbi:MAG: cupin [Proteobacteria bacterium]|nr:MAG: cupin [Pseudomonadota bacterium]PIE40325.1 MAG: cupin [Gammaproteobacteria bacterium]